MHTSSSLRAANTVGKESSRCFCRALYGAVSPTAFGALPLPTVLCSSAPADRCHVTHHACNVVPAMMLLVMIKVDAAVHKHIMPVISMHKQPSGHQSHRAWYTCTTRMHTHTYTQVENERLALGSSHLPAAE